jgi:hypothetical protein
VPGDALREDLGRLLRVPRLRFYFAISDHQQFFSAADAVATRGQLPFVRANGAEPLCVSCGTPLRRPKPSLPCRCDQCGQAHETLIALPMGAAVRAIVSFEMLRQTVALDAVRTYQEEGEIRALDREGGRA